MTPAPMTAKQLSDVAEELVARVGAYTEVAVNDWLDQVCPDTRNRKRLLLTVATMCPVDPGYDAFVRERFDVVPLKDLPRPR